MTELTAEQLAQRWIELYNDGTPENYGTDRFLSLYADEFDWRGMPSIWRPDGRFVTNQAQVREALADAQAVLRNRTAHLHDIVANGDRAAFRYLWEAQVGVDGFPRGRKGEVLRAELATFISARQGKIVRCIEFAAVLPNR